MKKLFFTSIFIAVAMASAFGQNDKEFRKPFTLKLSVDTTTFYEQEVLRSKYFVKDNILQIYPSESVLIEVEINENEIKSMKIVGKNKNPSKTIEINFIQKTNGRKHEFMMLEVKNPFKKILNYDAMMYIVGKDKWLKTSIIPVQPKLGSFEIWYDVIITLVLSNWRLE